MSVNDKQVMGLRVREGEYRVERDIWRREKRG